MRRLVVGALAVGVVGTLGDLLLLGHTESWQQWIPVAALSLGSVPIAFAFRSPSPARISLVRRSMFMWIVIGALGIYFHVSGNLEFERERDANASGLALVWDTATGATPVLSPGAMVLLGVIGLTFTHRHPARTSPGKDIDA